MVLDFPPAIRRALVARRWLQLLGFEGRLVFLEKHLTIDPMTNQTIEALLVTLRLDANKKPSAHPEFVFAAGKWETAFLEELKAAQAEWNAASQEEREALINRSMDLDRMSMVDFVAIVTMKLGKDAITVPPDGLVN